MDALVLIAISAGVVLLAAMIVFRVAKSPTRQRRRLRAEYARRVHLPPAQAYEALEQRVEVLMKEKPGQPLEWYFSHVLEELKRDRR